ncbi:hypothetical protein AB0K93_10555 [Streptomyces sp. NPDC052676]|uniref:hypothetical protein n=1 Tax=Streptomyces sp. NPDC052676 TaxID=3154953 RepID=UPI00343D866E
MREDQMSGNASSQRGLWLAIIITAGLCVATGTGLVFFAAGAEAVTILGASGTALVSFVGMGFAAHNFLGG